MAGWGGQSRVGQAGQGGVPAIFSVHVCLCVQVCECCV